MLVLLMLLGQQVYSQNYPGLGSWNILTLKKPLNDKFELWGEGQLRSLSFYNNFHYHELKGGVNYKLTKELTVSVNAGDYTTYTFGGNLTNPVTKEFRTWIELFDRQKFDRFNIEHRYRVEQRFSTTYSNRYRYRLSFVVPINKREIKPNTFYVHGCDEVFFNDSKSVFIRNRFMYGVGYKFERTTLQLGYMKQFDLKTQSDWLKNYIQVQMIYNFK